MATTAQRQLYPFATEDGKDIPLEVIRPLGAFFVNVPAGGSSFILPEKYEIVSAYSSEHALWSFLGNDPVAGTDNNEALFIPAQQTITAAIPISAAGKIVPLEGLPCLVVIQAIQRWAGIGMQRQLVRR